MSESIIDGTGNSYSAKVTPNNRLLTLSISETLLRSLNEDGYAWSIYNTVTPTGANDVFFYIRNDEENPLLLSKIDLMCAALETVLIKVVSGTPSGGTDVAAIPLNLGASRIPDATIQDGANITGLTDEGTLFFERLDTANRKFTLPIESDIFIPRGGACIMQAVTGGNQITYTTILAELFGM